MEAAGIGGFVLLAGAFTIFLEHPSMPVIKTWLWHYPALRRVILGTALGLYVSWTVLLFGKLSGTHVNPSVTWAFYRLGYIGIVDAICYIIAQFMGSIIAFYLLKFIAGNLFAYPLIDYGVSKSMPPHTTTSAFIAEFIISFILMITILLVSSSRKMEKYAAVFIGSLIGIYLIVELPYSGMSMNPARSFAASLGANEWRYLWIYFVSPITAMLVAAEVFILWRNKRIKSNHQDHKNLGMYPVKKSV